VTRVRRLWLVHASMCAIAALGVAFCHPPDQPPVPPPKPTNPTALAQRDPRDPDDVIDASIVTDGATGWDGGWKFELDTGAGPGRRVSATSAP
jgi:hypothetical protein